jgi:hypothetical protein
MSALESSPPGLFPPHREGRAGVLLAFVGLSLVAHAVAFLLFQVVYPQRVTIPPPRVQVALLNGSTPELQGVLRWVAAEDPALAAASPAAIPPSLFEVPYRPSFSTLRTPPRSMPAEAERPEPAPSPIVLPLLPDTAPAASPSPPVAAGPSTITLAGALAGRAFTPKGELRVRASAPLQPALFLVGASPRGAMRHVLLQRSSGDPAADQEAAAYLATGTLAPGAGEPLAWGFATLEWGGEIYAADPNRP